MIPPNLHDSLEDDRGKVRGRLRRLTLVLGLVVAVAAVALWYVGRDVLRLTTQVAVQVASVPETAPEVIPPFPATENPLAVLVLDVSGSMRHKDPTVETLRAASAFLKLFRHLAGGAATRGSAPNVAVVLYSSVPALIPWDGSWWRRLSSEADVFEVIDRIRPFLEPMDGAEDPRVGWHTDHRAAARLVGEVIGRYVEAGGRRDAVGVVFLTDGMFDPSPLLDGALPPEVARANAEEFWRRLAGEAGSAHSQGALDRLRRDFERAVRDSPLLVVPGAEDLQGRLFPVTTLWRGVSRTLTPRAGWYARAVAGLPVSEPPSVEELSRIMGVGGGGLYREVVLAVGDPALADSARGRGAMAVLESRRLDLAFATVLAEWLRLQEQQVDGSGFFTVNPGARSLAVLAVGPNGPAEGSVRGPGVTSELVNGIGLVEDPRPGVWRVDLVQAVARAQIYHDVRSKWAIHDMPVSFNMFDGPVEAGIGLYNLETGSRESPSTIYRGWPTSIRVTLTQSDGDVVHEAAAFRQDLNSYRFRLAPREGGSPGAITIEGVVEGLVFEDGRPAPEVRVVGSTLYRRAIRVRLLAEDGNGRAWPAQAIERMSLNRGARMVGRGALVR